MIDKKDKTQTIMKKQHILTFIAVCGMTGASLGIPISTAGIFYSPISVSLGAGKAAVSLMYTIVSMGMALFAIFIPALLKKIPVRRLVLTGAVLLLGGTFLTAMCNAMWEIIALSFVRAAGVGCLSVVICTMIINNWFYEKRGILTSILMTFTGIPGIILSPVFSSLTVKYGWHTGYMSTGIAIAVLLLPAVIFPLTLTPEEQGLKPYGYEEYEAYKQSRPEEKEEKGAELQTFNYLSPAFILAMVFSMTCCFMAAIPQHFPSYAESIGMSAATGSMMLSIVNLANIVCKMLYGSVVDKLGGRNTMLMMGAINLAGIAGLLFIHVPFVMIICAALYTFTYSISSVGIVTLAADIFGLQNYPKTYPLMNFSGGMALAAGSSICGLLYDLSGSYFSTLVLALCVEVVVLVTMCLSYSLKKKQTV